MNLDYGSIYDEANDQKPVEGYEFPDMAGSEYYRKFGKASDRQSLVKLVGFLWSDPKDKSSDDYLDVREKYCALGIFLNEHCMLPPAFRRIRRLKRATGLSDGDKTFALDGQVIDLHYLYSCRKDVVRPKDETLKALFRGDQFDFSLAVEFALKEIPFDRKVRAIGVTEDTLKELASLRMASP